MKFDITLNASNGEILYKETRFGFMYNSKNAANITLLEQQHGTIDYRVEVLFDVPNPYKNFYDLDTVKPEFREGVSKTPAFTSFTTESEALQHAIDVLRAIFEKFL